MPKHRSKAQPRSRSFSYGLRCRCVWVGQGFEGFLDLREKVFFLLKCPGAVLPPQVEFQVLICCTSE
ncbi:Ycf20-like protein, partial [Zea mays]